MDRDLLFHLLQASVAEMDKRAHGSTMKHIKRVELAEFGVALPASASEQARLAQVLDTVDATIRQTEAIIEKLKQVKQGLLHDLLTRGVDENGELRPPQSEAPHLYKESALGWIPTGWMPGPLGGWLDGRPKNGYSPQESWRWTGVQMLGLACLTTSGFLPCQLKNAPIGDARLRAAILMPGDLLISRANTRELVGLAGIYKDVGTQCTYQDLMMRLTPAKSILGEFMELALTAASSRQQIQALASGTSGSMTKISAGIVLALKIAVPGVAEQIRIRAALESVMQRLRAEGSSLMAWQATKTGLMDDLLTGRVRVTPLLTAA